MIIIISVYEKISTLNEHVSNKLFILIIKYLGIFNHLFVFGYAYTCRRVEGYHTGYIASYIFIAACKGFTQGAI